MKEYEAATNDEEEKKLLSQATSRFEGTARLMTDAAKKAYSNLIDELTTVEEEEKEKKDSKAAPTIDNESDKKRKELDDDDEVKVVLNLREVDRMQVEIDEQAKQQNIQQMSKEVDDFESAFAAMMKTEH